MSQAHKGSRLLLANQVVPVEFNTAFFNFKEDAIGVQYGNAIYPTSGLYSMRKLEGKFGGGVAIDEGTTNITPIADGRWGIAKSNFQGTVTVTTSANASEFGFATSARFDFKPRLDPSGSGWQVAQYNIALPYVTGNMYTASIYVRKLSNHDGLSVRILDSNGTLQQGSAMNMPAGFPVGEWTRLSMTWTASMTSGGGQFYTSANENASFELANPLLEAKSFPTSFVNGTRGNGSLQYNASVINKYAGTISCWIYNVPRADTTYRRIVSFIGQGTTINGEDDIHFDITDTKKLRLRPSKANAISVSSVNSIQDFKWNHCACSWGPSGFKVYLNGVLEASSSIATGIPEIDTLIAIGHDNRRTVAYLGGILEELRIDKYQVTDEEIMSWYLSGVPFYNPYDYRGYAY